MRSELYIAGGVAASSENGDTSSFTWSMPAMSPPCVATSAKRRRTVWPANGVMSKVIGVGFTICGVPVAVW